MKTTEEIRIEAENNLQFDPLAGVNEWLYWSLIAATSIANAITLYQILTTTS